MKLFPSCAPEFIKQEGKLWLIYERERERPRAYVFLTTDYVPGIKGYAGPIKTLVGLKDDGRLSGIHLISHNETPAYVFEIEEDAFALQFQDKQISDLFEHGGDLDAITQATISASAIYRSVKNSARLVAQERLGINLPLEETKVEWRKFFASSSPYAVVLIFGLAIINFYVPIKAFRYSIMALSISYLGFYQQNYYSVFNLINILAFRIPVFTHLSWYLLMGLVVAVTVGFGRLYCGRICPFGALSEFLYIINPYHLPLSPRYDKIMREFKYYLTGGVVLIAVGASRLEIANFEPFKVTFTLKFFSFVGGLTSLILLISLVNYRFWCKYFCPAGASLALLSALSLGRYKIVGDCGECLSCGNECFSKIAEDKSKSLAAAADNTECITCGRCVEACPDKAIKPALKIGKVR